MAEFSWECMGERACATCPVKAYLDKHPDTTDAEKRDMVEAAARAGIQSNTRPARTVATELFLDMSLPNLGFEAANVSVKGIRQWEMLHCIENIRRAPVNNI